MKEDKDIFDQFREKDQTSQVRPSAQAWEKLSSKLDNFQHQRSTVIPLRSRLRKWYIAASILLVVGLAAIILPTMGSKKVDQMAMMEGPMLIEDLEYAKPSGFYALAIKTNKYYNTSPRTLASESNNRRLQLTDRKTRMAKQPSYLANQETDIDNAQIASATESNAATTAAPTNPPIAMTETEVMAKLEVEEEKGIPAAEFDAGYIADQTVSNADDISKDAAESTVMDEVILADYNGQAATEDAVATRSNAAKKAKMSEAEMSESVVTASSAPATSIVNINDLKWLVGNWKSKERNGQVNNQQWALEDSFTIIGNAQLKINDQLVNEEYLSIQLRGGQLFLERKNNQEGNTLIYLLQAMEAGTAVFRHPQSGDEIRLKQQSINVYSNGFISNQSLQLNQYPNVLSNEVEFIRIEN